LSVGHPFWREMFGMQAQFAISGRTIKMYGFLQMRDAYGSGLGMPVPLAATRVAGVKYRSQGSALMPIWDDVENAGTIGSEPMCEFPPSLNRIAGTLLLVGGEVWNAAHPLISGLDHALFSALLKTDIANIPSGSLETIRAHCTDPAFCRAILVFFLKTRNPEKWRGLVDRDRDLANAIWENARQIEPLEFIHQRLENANLATTRYVYTRKGVDVERDPPPVPELEWTITVTGMGETEE
jgi:hypothetical protein